MKGFDPTDQNVSECETKPDNLVNEYVTTHKTQKGQ